MHGSRSRIEIRVALRFRARGSDVTFVDENRTDSFGVGALMRRDPALYARSAYVRSH